MTLHEYLKHHRLFTDGAMGTYYEKKYREEDSFAEQANILFPERIVQIHLDYLRSGAQLLRTNTFAVNSLFFPTREEVLNHIRKGYRLAQKAVQIYQNELQERGEPVPELFVAADFGPIHQPFGEDEKLVIEEYQAICDAFFEEGAQNFIFETQTDFHNISDMISYIKEKNPEAFILAQFAFDKSGYTKSGISIRRLNEMAASCKGLDAYGFNCGVGAGHLFHLLENLPFPEDKYISALPNAGYPLTLRGRTVYADNEDYFVQMMEKIAGLGIDLLGGCCGTTPEYIRDLKSSLLRMPVTEKKRTFQTAVSMGAKAASGQKYNSFYTKLQNGEKPIVVELDPPFQTDISKVMDGAVLLKEAGADLLTLSDSPMARARMDAGALAAKVQREAGIPVMPHLCCRDKNLIGLRSAILGNYMNEIRQMLIVTGDPVGRDARGRVKGVFDVNSIKLMQFMQEMNVELFGDEPFIYGGALNYHGANPDAIAQRMKLKMDAGCAFFLTQPIYSQEDIARIRELKGKTGAKVFCGIMPLVSYKNAMFIHNEMPGIHVSDEVLKQYTPEMSREEAEDVAVRISVKSVKELEPITDGYYFMTPFNRAGLIAKILRQM